MSQTTRLHLILGALKTQWRALGGFGKVAVFGMALSMILAVALGFIIPGLVRADLVAGRSSSIANVVGDLVQKELLTSSDPSDEELSRLDDAVRLTLLGRKVGFTLGVVWGHTCSARVKIKLDRLNEARQDADEILKIWSWYNLDYMRSIYLYKDSANLEHWIDGLRMAGMPEHAPSQ